MHSHELEKKVEIYKEQQAMFKIMMNDLELYKQKAEMSKELATYFSPFTPIQAFSQQQLYDQKQIRENVIDVKFQMKGKDTELIKKMEKEIQNLQDQKTKNVKLQEDCDKYKKRWHEQKEKREELEKKVDSLESDNKTIQDQNTATNAKLKELIQEKMARGGKAKESGAVEVGKLSDEQVNFAKIKKDLEDQNADLMTRVETAEANLTQEQQIKRNLKAERSELMDRITVLKKQVEQAGGDSNAQIPQINTTISPMDKSKIEELEKDLKKA